MAFQLKVVKSTQNQLLNRKELQIEILHTLQSCPKKEDVTAELGTNYSLEPKNIYVYSMRTAQGQQLTMAKANIYNSFEDLKKIERAFVVARITGEKITKVPRRQKKDARIKKYKRFGTLKRNMQKLTKKANDK